MAGFVRAAHALWGEGGLTCRPKRPVAPIFGPSVKPSSNALKAKLKTAHVAVGQLSGVRRAPSQGGTAAVASAHARDRQQMPSPSRMPAPGTCTSGTGREPSIDTDPTAVDDPALVKTLSA